VLEDNATIPPVLPVSCQERGMILDEELQRLAAGDRDALMICHIEGLSYEDAAPQLGWSSSDVRRRLQPAREMLGQRLQRRGVKLSAMGMVIALADLARAPLPAGLLGAMLRWDSPGMPALCCS
jgi:hypothetical protein